MAHQICTTCTCGHLDHLHGASRLHACRVRSCDCTHFVARDRAGVADPKPDRRRIRRQAGLAAKMGTGV
jgi:hypothetical protein